MSLTQKSFESNADADADADADAKTKKHQAILTISIPTYNRSKYLDYLLESLASELVDLKKEVVVQVFDNASTDETEAVVGRHSSKLHNFSSFRSKKNNGSDANILSCFKEATTPYVWILGDDDIPIRGSVKLIVAKLRSEQPDLMYLNSISTFELRLEHIQREVTRISPKLISKEQFTKSLNVKLTFISAVIVRKLADSTRVERISDDLMESSLIQLAWVYDRLASGEKFLYVPERAVIATADNRGGYAALDVFINRHALIARHLLANEPTLANNIISRTASCHIPLLIWNIRRGKAGDFELPALEDFHMPTEISRSWSYFVFIRPIWVWPEPLASTIGYCALAFAKSMAIIDRLTSLKQAI